MTFEEIYKNTEEKVKTDFLYKLLQKDKKLRTKFLKSIPPVETVNANALMNYEEFSQGIKEAYDDFSDLIEDIDLTAFDWEDYTPPHGGYVEEWEAYDTMAEEEIDSALGGFADEILKNLLQGKITDILIDLIAFQEAAEDSDIDNPNYVLGEDIPDYLISFKLKGEWIELINKRLPESRIDDDELINGLKLFFKYIEENNMVCSLSLYESLLLNLIEKVSDKNKIPALDTLTGIDKKHFPKAANAIIKYTDKDNWEEAAASMLFEDKSIAEELLERYLQKGEKQKYIETLKKLFDNDRRYWAKHIVKNIKPDEEKQLYIKANIRRCIDKNDVKYYKNIKQFISDNEKEAILNEISYNEELKAEILKTEGKIDRIKEIIRELTGQWHFSFKILNTIKEHDPDFAFEMIKKHIDKQMHGEKRKRSTYESIAKWLIYAGKLKGQKEKADKLTMLLYNHKPNLPALKDEFRIAGLVKKK